MAASKNSVHLFKMYAKRHRYAVLRGGTRSGKTWSALEFIFWAAVSGQFNIASIVAVSVPHLKRGAQRDWDEILKKYNWQDYEYNATDRIYYFKKSLVEFFSADNSAKLRGAQRDWLFVNEVNLLTEQDFNELDVRTREFVIVDFNPVARFWLYELFEKIEVPINKIECVSTYKDNPYLSPQQLAAIESRRGLPEWWRVYGEGRWGATQGAAWYNWDITDIKNIKYDLIGVDFGLGTSPTAIIGIKLGQDTHIADEIFYGQGDLLTMAEILKTYNNIYIVGDSAQIDIINLLRKEGVNIYPAYKMSLVASYHYLNLQKILITANSENLIKEARGVEWSDKARGILKAGCADHAVDAVRYALQTAEKFIKRE